MVINDVSPKRSHMGRVQKLKVREVRFGQSCLEQLPVPVGLSMEKLTPQPRNLVPYAEFTSEVQDYVIPCFPTPWNNGFLIMIDVNMGQRRNHSHSNNNFRVSFFPNRTSQLAVWKESEGRCLKSDSTSSTTLQLLPSQHVNRIKITLTL